MFFLNCDVSNGIHTMDTTLTTASEFDSITLQNGIFDEFFVSKNADETGSITSSSGVSWGSNTIMDAKFNGSLNGGNIDYALNQLTSLKICRRRLNTFKWLTLFEIPITRPEDCNIEVEDRYARSGVDYEYAIVPKLGDVDGDYNTLVVHSSFDGLFLMEKDQSYGTRFNLGMSLQKNSPTEVVATINEKYPVVFSNGNANYYSGSTNGTFLRTDAKTCDFVLDGTWEYIDQLMEFLHDRKPKIQKYPDGRMQLIRITDASSDQAPEHPDAHTISYSWVEIGNCEDAEDLYNNGLIDALPDR